MPKQIKAEFTLNVESKTYDVDYYMRNHTKQVTDAKFVDESNNLLLMYGAYWVRKYPNNSLSKKENQILSFNQSIAPYCEKLSDKTMYVRIPSFAIEQKERIDSVLAKYDPEITSTPNLIIDIRNGTGGSDESYSNIIPYLYTNPIRSVGVQLFATELNAQGYENYAKQYSDSQDINYCNDVAKTMRMNLGKFISLSEQTFDIDSLAKIMPFPKQVAIICNQNNGSTDEQFLLDAKQSDKVKVFGRATGGMLDISNMNFIDFPNGQFQLGYCMSKSYRIPNYCIDGIGIQPDYFIDDAIEQNDWVEYTKNVLEQ